MDIEFILNPGSFHLKIFNLMISAEALFPVRSLTGTGRWNLDISFQGGHNSTHCRVTKETDYRNIM